MKWIPSLSVLLHFKAVQPGLHVRQFYVLAKFSFAVHHRFADKAPMGRIQD